MDAPSNFPAITFCNHQPFSSRAYELWRSGEIISPTQFSKLLKNAADYYLNASQSKNQSFPQEAGFFAFEFDTVKMYYQNLDWQKSKLLGHERNQSIYMCLFRYSGGNLVIGGPGCHDDMIIIRERSHPHHFNCHTVEVSQAYSQEVQELGLIIWLGPNENYNVQYRQAFLMDLFEQAYGLRVAIHEPGQLANLDSQGIQIEPGRMNELNFDAVKTIHQETPRKPCIHQPKQMYTDLEQEYNYEFELCLNTHLQNLLITQCTCLYAYLPRVKLPNISLPYCGHLITTNNQSLDTTGILTRKECVRNILSKSAILKKSFEDNGLCLRRCELVDYESTASVTTWRSTRWQLHWSQETSAALEVLFSLPMDVQNVNNTNDKALKNLQVYFRTDNLSLITSNFHEKDSLTEAYGFSDRYTYLLVKRKSNDTIVKAETLVLTLNALVSRIGGLCSLYIGMTFAVFIEFIEFFYIFLLRNGLLTVSNKNNNDKNKNDKQKNMDDNDIENKLDQNCQLDKNNLSSPSSSPSTLHLNNKKSVNQFLTLTKSNNNSDFIDYQSNPQFEFPSSECTQLIETTDAKSVKNQNNNNNDNKVNDSPLILKNNFNESVDSFQPLKPVNNRSLNDLNKQKVKKCSI
uniref:Uncharacterized protein n=1 Tax=Trichobilharzia regenti TaxID=157069 RepID=A0AA85IPB6_TRIRE|nr:unnamed protein product [Trichobilharzia regenti]